MLKQDQESGGLPEAWRRPKSKGSLSPMAEWLASISFYKDLSTNYEVARTRERSQGPLCQVESRLLL